MPGSPCTVIFLRFYFRPLVWVLCTVDTGVILSWCHVSHFTDFVCSLVFLWAVSSLTVPFYCRICDCASALCNNILHRPGSTTKSVIFLRYFKPLVSSCPLCWSHVLYFADFLCSLMFLWAIFHFSAVFSFLIHDFASTSFNDISLQSTVNCYWMQSYFSDFTLNQLYEWHQWIQEWWMYKCDYDRNCQYMCKYLIGISGNKKKDKQVLWMSYWTRKGVRSSWFVRVGYLASCMQRLTVTSSCHAQQQIFAVVFWKYKVKGKNLMYYWRNKEK